MIWIAGLSLAAIVASGCKSAPPKATPATHAAATVTSHLVSQLANARIDAAKTKLDQCRPDEALPLLVSALQAEPSAAEARNLITSILSETVWNLPTLRLNHPMPIEQIALATPSSLAAPSSLWVSLGGKTHTLVRWNLETLQIESVLFPQADNKTRSFVFGPGNQSLIIERGATTLLCNAQTLKPIRELGALPDFLTPAAVLVFSADGLLLAHPSLLSEQDHSLVWRLRDSASGEIIRSSEPLSQQAPPAVAAFLDRQHLRVLQADGSLMEMPISPVLPPSTTPAPQPLKLLQAQFSHDGNTALTLQAQAAHQPPSLATLSFGESKDGSLETEAMTQRFPWSRQPNIWNGLMANSEQLPFTVDRNLLKILTQPHAPVIATAPIRAAAFSGKNVLTGDENGVLTLHQLLPLPGQHPSASQAAAIDETALHTLQNLSLALTAKRFVEKDRSFSQLDPEERLKAFTECNFDALRAIFPQLDFSLLLAAFKAAELRTAAPSAFRPLLERCARADSSANPWPGLAAMTAIFQSHDSAAILATLQSAGTKGPAAANALALALQSDHPEWIEACLASAVELPPLLGQISHSRIAWLQGRKADALACWPEVFPELAEIRRREDWDGWEQADFAPALAQVREAVCSELNALEVPESSTPEQRKAIIARFTDPATFRAIGRNRFAQASLKAALAFSAHPQESQATFQLAQLARELGAPAEPCLRAEALALTALNNYSQAHLRWIELITEHPLNTQLPSDYAEAAYTAFENTEPRQAMEILTTGMHRFPQDSNFALRAGWVALLTGNSERAYRFLREGQRIGFAEDKRENATALLTIAAAQTGASDDAAVYFQDLLKLDPAWAEPKTLEALDWPEELKASLRQYCQ